MKISREYFSICYKIEKYINLGGKYYEKEKSYNFFSGFNGIEYVIGM